jgi:uridine kinase
MSFQVKIISFVGVPASGKSSLASHFGRTLENSIYAKDFEPRRNKAILNDQVLVIINESLRINRLLQYAHLNQIEFIFQDRGIEDILCFTNYIYKHQPNKLDFINNLANARCISSNYIIYLDINSAEKEKRELIRHKSTYGRDGTNMNDYNAFYKNYFRQRNNINIFNNSISEDMAIKELHSYFEKMRRNSAI